MITVITIALMASVMGTNAQLPPPFSIPLNATAVTPAMILVRPERRLLVARIEIFVSGSLHRTAEQERLQPHLDNWIHLPRLQEQ